MSSGRSIAIRGTVQGVGFRPFVHRLARRTGVTGRVRNDEAGVTIEAFGDEERLAAFVAGLARGAPAAARIRELVSTPIPAEAAQSFTIAPSRPAAERRVSIPPDLATCPDCLRELQDPGDRRYRYPFINCTACGPRFTIVRDVPYDRRLTSMAGFAMCEACRREYEDVEDRRHHAQPDACPACGPRLVALTPDGTSWGGDDPLRRAARAIASGGIVAVKGLGGFHLACDARSNAALARLRERKRRDAKPFAVMVRDLAAAEELGVLDAAERDALASVERPVVLVRRRPDAPLAAHVAPELALVGLMLPYTPLHHLLLAETGCPVVMTSANLSDEPLVYRDEEAMTRLAGLADLLLTHDRPIENRCDDSVVRVVAGRPTLLRRARGYVPRPLPVRRPVRRPVLAVGAHLKSAICLAAGDGAWLGPHVGDLESEAACREFEACVERMQRFLRVAPEVVAHDLHPDYHSTRYALARPERVKVAVQHHHAHVASAMAEHGLAGPVLGVAYDGAGYGTDGALWGGELLLADYAGFERLATFRPLPLAGGEAAVWEVWRLALALLDDAFEGAPPLERLPLFRAVPEAGVGVVRRMIDARLNAPPAHGVGRYFDAFGALALGRPSAAYEGQVALLLNLAAGRAAGPAYPFALDTTREPWLVDLRPAVRAAVEDLLAGKPAERLAAAFHDAIVEATVHMLRRAARLHGRLPVVLSGGCFQNPRLAEGVAGALAGEASVFLHREVPPGDGGIALGQALVADAVASKE